MSKKIMIGHKLDSWYFNDYRSEAQRACDIANAQVIPALKEAEIPITLEAVRSGLADRNYIVEEGVKITLDKLEYRNLPELLRKAVAEQRADELRAVVNCVPSNGVRLSTTSTPPKSVSRKESQFIKLNGETLKIDDDALLKLREIWIEGDEQCAAFEDYKKAVDALNKLFGGHLLKPHDLYTFFAGELRLSGGNPAKVNPEQFNHKLMEIVSARRNPNPYEVAGK